MAGTIAPDAGTTAAAPSSVTSSDDRPIDAEIGALLGDFTEEDRDESAGTPAPDAGAPPAAEPTGTPAPPAPSVEGAPATPDAGAPPATATPTLDDTATFGSPATYTVNGENRTLEGLMQTEHGLYIEAKDAPKLLQRLSERDNLYERSQQVYEQHQASERQLAEFNRLTEWKAGDQTLTGAPAIEAMRTTLASAVMALDTLTRAFKGDPVKYLSQDETGRIIWNPEAIESLSLRSSLAERNAADQVRAHLQSIRGDVQHQATTQQEDAKAPQIMWQQVEAAWVKPHPTLTDADKQFLSSQMPRYIRPATRDEIAAGAMRNVVDISFQQVIADRAALRAESAKTVQAHEKAAAENARRLAAASAGNRAPTPQTPATPAPSPKTQRAKEERQAWDFMEAAAAGRRPSAS